MTSRPHSVMKKEVGQQANSEGDFEGQKPIKDPLQHL